jgi:hypothetical protein
LNIFEIPLKPAQAQEFGITLLGTRYLFSLRFNTRMQNWVLDIADTAAVPILRGVPLVTGTDLFGQYESLGFGGALMVITPPNGPVPPDSTPSFTGLGVDSRLYFITGPIPGTLGVV